MERESSIDVLIILGTAAIAFFALVTIVVMIIYKRKVFIKETMMNYYQNECKAEIKALKTQIETLENEVSALKQKNG